MKKYGILNKQTNKLVKTYSSKYIKLDKNYSDSSTYEHFEILLNNYPESYRWNGSNIEHDPHWQPTPNPTDKIAIKIVNKAIIFGQKLIAEFGGENVALGITASGKTADVLSIMEEKIEIDPINKPGVKISVMAAVTSGSLYEARSTIQYHINKANNGDYSSLEPFITPSRLINFKQKIIDYLS